MKRPKLSAESHSSLAQTQYTEHIDRPNRHFLAIRYFATIHSRGNHRKIHRKHEIICGTDRQVI